ncbi:unnamed protein product [Rangifer tarandus platyrhynchus]|uniref:Uncharacterized protein n=1 Tax=Rangifer tarandus platyrhynchus TaxID=3082113 RepID=A0AC60A5F7_RANTA
MPPRLRLSVRQRHLVLNLSLLAEGARAFLPEPSRENVAWAFVTRPRKGRPEVSPCRVLTQEGHRKKKTFYERRREPSPRTKPAGALILDFQPPELVNCWQASSVLSSLSSTVQGLLKQEQAFPHSPEQEPSVTQIVKLVPGYQENLKKS